MFYFHPELWGSDPIWLPHIFQMGWFDHHLEKTIHQNDKWHCHTSLLPTSKHVNVISWSRCPPGYPSSRGCRLQEGGRFFSTPKRASFVEQQKHQQKTQGRCRVFFCVLLSVSKWIIYIKHPKRHWILIFVCSFWHTICSYFATFIWRWVFSCIIVFLDQDLQVVYCLSCGSKMVFSQKNKMPKYGPSWTDGMRGCLGLRSYEICFPWLMTDQLVW